MTRFFDYAAEFSGIQRSYDLAAPVDEPFSQNLILGLDDLCPTNQPMLRRRVLEWSDISHAKRTGLGGMLWQAPVTVQASQNDPQAAFAVSAEDDVPRYKFLITLGKDNAYVTYSDPPYDSNHATESVVWHLNVSAGGWTAAAKPYAESLVTRGYTKRRSAWGGDISLVIFVPGVSEGYIKPLIAFFPADARKHILLWIPQSWRAFKNTKDPKTDDSYYWDNTYSDSTARDLKAALSAGFHVSVYINPHYRWGKPELVIDPEIRQIVEGFAKVPILDTISCAPVLYQPNSLAYTPYREFMVKSLKGIYDDLKVTFYLDCTDQWMLDGRGRAVDGMTSYEGAYRFYKGLKAVDQNLYLGSEFVNELAVMAGGSDYGLQFGIGWASDNPTLRTRMSHPIVNYLYQHTSVQVEDQDANWSQGNKEQEYRYHLGEEIVK